MTLLSSQDFAIAAALPGRTARYAFEVCAQGKTWRGHDLPVVQLPGQRGGVGGVTWGLDLTRATPELLDDLPGLKAHMDAPAVPAERTSPSDIEPWRVKVQAERFEIIKPAISTKVGSSARAETLGKIALTTVTYREERVRLDVRTLRRWLQDYERAGLIGLLPKPNGQPGKRRVMVSLAWDKGIDLAEDHKAAVAASLDRYTQSLIAKSVSGMRVEKLARKRLVELCLDAGSALARPALENLCRINARYTGRFKDWKRVARHDLDNKLFFDKDLPRVSRGRCAWPMEVVYGDVHPIDIFIPAPDGKGQLRLRLIAWMDDCTRKMWVTVAVMGKGNGIRQTDIADALFRLVCDPTAGVARTLYLDHGSEYSVLGEAMMEIPGALSAFSELGGVVNAQPYNGPAKGLIEHTFSTLEQGYFKHLPGWIGGDRTNKKTHAVGKPVKGFQGTLEEFICAVLDMVGKRPA